MAAIDASVAPKGSEGVDNGGGMGLDVRGLCGMAGGLATGWVGGGKVDVGLVRWVVPDMDMDGTAGGCMECGFVSPMSRLLFMRSAMSSGLLRFDGPFKSAAGVVGEY